MQPETDHPSSADELRNKDETEIPIGEAQEPESRGYTMWRCRSCGEMGRLEGELPEAVPGAPHRGRNCTTGLPTDGRPALENGAVSNWAAARRRRDRYTGCRTASTTRSENGVSSFPFPRRVLPVPRA